jgi:hypothetical protein
LLFFSTQPIYAGECLAFEKVCDGFPDRTIALRILCSNEPATPDNIDPNLITAAELVSLPSKISKFQIT